MVLLLARAIATDPAGGAGRVGTTVERAVKAVEGAVVDSEHAAIATAEHAIINVDA